MSFDVNRIFLRLNFIQDNLQKLQRFEQISQDDYLSNFEQQLMVERLLELIIQAGIDINRHIITKGLGLKFPKESKQSFMLLWQNDLLTEELAKELAKSAGLRNLLAHEYLEINHSVVYKAIPKALTQYPLYIQQITNYLDSLE